MHHDHVDQSPGTGAEETIGRRSRRPSGGRFTGRRIRVGSGRLRAGKGNTMRIMLFASTAVAIVGLYAPAAYAQDTAQVQLDEVVVTAQRRSENLQKTPLT